MSDQHTINSDYWGKLMDATQVVAPPPDPFAGIKKKKAKLETPPAEPSIITLAPISPADWEALSGKGKWDSIVALRGPDLVGSSAIKNLTTSVIRFRLSQVMRVGGQVNDWLPFTILPNPFPRARQALSFDWGHFLTHVMEASSWLGIPHTTIPLESWKIAVTPTAYNGLYQAAYLSTIMSGSYAVTLKSILTRNFGVSEEVIPQYAQALAQAKTETAGPAPSQPSEGGI